MIFFIIIIIFLAAENIFIPLTKQSGAYSALMRILDSCQR